MITENVLYNIDGCMVASCVGRKVSAKTGFSPNLGKYNPEEDSPTLGVFIIVDTKP